METVNLSQAFSLTKTFNISKFNYRITSINLFKSIHGIVQFADSEGNILCENSFNIFQEDYKDWGTDDTFIYNWIEKNIETLVR